VLFEEKTMNILVETTPLQEGDPHVASLIFTTKEGVRHRVYPIMKDCFDMLKEPLPDGYEAKHAKRKLPQSMTEVVSFHEIK